MPQSSTIPLSATRVRTSKIQGRGLFAVTNLPGRRKLGEISGQLVKLPLARKAIETAPQIYFIELSSRWALECSEGNQFKHLNHSCVPNCYLRVFEKRVEVYTLRRIPAARASRTPSRSTNTSANASATSRASRRSRSA